MKPGTPLEPIGATIAGRYLVEETLGQGGMAVVYRVHDERAGKRVALKRSWSDNPNRLRRHELLLEREYHMLAQLAHPRIIEVYDFGVDANGPFYTMELLDGENLEQVDRLPWHDACAVLHDVASSLAIVHSRGLVHRDVSMRNVHYAADGHAKLFDFGAMMSMGVAKDAVGTPPFMAPEVLQLQALDGRADLFSLGALAYRLVTGRHAFPARRFAELRDAWRSKPQAPSAIVPAVPAALSSLILRMLTLDRAGRPQSAAEVIEQLRTIASLKLEDAAEISRAYLTTPTLVGRESALLEVRRRMLGLVRGDGGLLLVQGVSGSGRSRLLDACALEAKLLGVTVVRADANDAANGDWGVTREIASQLLAQFPQQAVSAARLSHDVIGHVVEELRSHAAVSVMPERSVLTRELRDWVLALCKTQRLLIVVDDADHIDDPSIGLLTALAHRADRHALLLALTVENSAHHASSTALQLLHTLSAPLELEDIQPHETEALIRSLFGDVANLPLCAARIHGLSHGNPRAAMELAQHLVATGRARYEAGSWSLPPTLDERDLPTSLAASLATRLAELSSDARELIDALAIADDDALGLSAYAGLTEHHDVKRVFRALDELVAARILAAGDERYTFTQRGFLSVLHAALGREQRELIHQRIAQLLAANGGNELRRAHHLFGAALDADAIALLCQLDLTARVPSVALVTTAIERAERLGEPARVLHRLRMALLISAPYAMESEIFRRVLPLVVEQLEHDSGLIRYRALGQLPEGERLHEALSRTQQAYLATPEHERVNNVVEAIRELGRLASMIASMAAPSFDYELIESLPDLSPLSPLSPALPILAQLMNGAKAWMCGRTNEARTIYGGILERIAAPDRGGFDAAQQQRVRAGLEYALGLVEATYGNPTAEERAHTLEEQLDLRVNGLRVRSLYQLALGNVKEARKTARRAALLLAQEGHSERYVGSTVGIELLLTSRLGNLLDVKALLPPLAAIAAKHRGWRSVELLGRSRYCELQGDPKTALQLIEDALALAPPSRLAFFAAIAGSHVSLLHQLGRDAEARERLETYIDYCTKNQILAPLVYQEHVLYLGRTGKYAEALLHLEGMIARSLSFGCAGLALGILLEIGARLAIAERDRTTFESYVERCAREYEKAKNPVVAARLARVIEQANEAGMRAHETVIALQHSIQPSALESESETVHSRIAECIDSSDRARCALTLLMQTTASRIGYLYAMGAERSIALLAALPEQPNEADIGAWLEQCASVWLQPSAEDDTTGNATAVTATLSQSRDEEWSPTAYRDTNGRVLEAVPLFDHHDTGYCLAGVLVLQTTLDQRVFPPKQLCASLARELLEYGDATGWWEERSA